MSSTLDRLRRIVTRTARCDEEKINPETILRDLRIDSLDWVQIIATVEGVFDIEIDIERMNDFGTIADLVTYIDSHTS